MITIDVLFKENKVNIGDRVASQRIGQPFTGTVVAVLKSYLGWGLSPNTNEVWAKYYENWKEHNYVFVKLDQHMKPLSLDQFLLFGGTKEGYENVPMVNHVTHPIIDLVLIEDIDKVQNA